MGDRSRLPGMARYGIDVHAAYGVAIPDLRRAAKRVGRDHALADDLWASGIREGRILATMVADPALVTPEEMDAWVVDLTDWELCDHACGNLWERTPHGFAKARAWADRPEEFVRRAAFVLIATAAVHRKDLPDRDFVQLMPSIRRAARDERNYVRKAVSWALRQTGKRNQRLNERAVAEAERLLRSDVRSARWIARDVLRELRSDAVRERLGR
jgi:3-methyladenine DNA glycosylase AlkD